MLGATKQPTLGLGPESISLRVFQHLESRGLRAPLRVLQRNRTDERNPRIKQRFTGLKYRTFFRLAKDGHLVQEAVNLEVTWSMKLDVSAVPVWPWEPGGFLECWSSASARILEKQVPTQARDS